MRGLLYSLIITISAIDSALGQVGGITGVVLDGAANPLAAATVLYKSIPGIDSVATAIRQAAPIALPVNSAAITDANGVFRTTGLLAWVYYICALAPSSGQLSSCRYSPKPVIVRISAGQQVGGVTLRTLSGSVVRVRVLDAAGRIPQGHRFAVVSVATDGTYEIGRQISQSAGETDYELTIPNNRSSSLMVQTDLSVTDTTGAAVPLRQPVIPLPTTSAPASSPFVVTLIAQ